MSAQNSSAITFVLQSDSSPYEESALMMELRARISELERANDLLAQEKERELWAIQEKLDKLQLEFKGEYITRNGFLAVSILFCKQIVLATAIQLNFHFFF